MARGTQLLQLVENLREEVGRASSVAVGNADLPGLKQKIRRTQASLYDDYDWPFLRQVFPPLYLQAGERYYDLPAGLHLERIESVVLWYSDMPQPIERGISPRDYGVYNSLEDVRQEPALKWDVRWTGTAEQIEIWPIPVSNSQFLQFTGLRDLRPLVQDSDVADLDDDLIVLWAASDVLARQGSNSAGVVLKLAQNKLSALRKRNKGAERTRRMGMGGASEDQRFPIVVHARST